MVDQISVQCPDCLKAVHVDVTEATNNVEDALKIVHQHLKNIGWEHVHYGLFYIFSKLVCDNCKHKYMFRTPIKL